MIDSLSGVAVGSGDSIFGFVTFGITGILIVLFTVLKRRQSNDRKNPASKASVLDTNFLTYGPHGNHSHHHGGHHGHHHG
jgi:hypothetical protein